VASVEYRSQEDSIGRIQNLRDGGQFGTSTYTWRVERLHKSSIPGIRVPSEIHVAAAMAAKAHCKSLNYLAAKALKNAADTRHSST